MLRRPTPRSQIRSWWCCPIGSNGVLFPSLVLRGIGHVLPQQRRHFAGNLVPPGSEGRQDLLFAALYRGRIAEAQVGAPAAAQPDRSGLRRGIADCDDQVERLGAELIRRLGTVLVFDADLA